MSFAADDTALETSLSSSEEETSQSLYYSRQTLGLANSTYDSTIRDP